jgi:hypothetical protein
MLATDRKRIGRNPGLSRRATVFVALMLPGWIAACDSGERPPGPVAQMRDSAGVTIVDNLEPAVRIRLSPGSTRVDPTEREPAFRLTGIVAIGDSVMVVANTGGHSIDAYDAAGTLLWRTGREGEGPGEFKGDLRVFRYRGDSLLAYDWNLRRLTVLNAGGQPGRTATLLDAEPNPDVIGTLADGSVVVASRHLSLGLGLHVDSTVIALHSPEGGRLRELTSLQVEPVCMTYVRGMPVIDTQPLAGIASIAARADQLAIARGRQPASESIAADGGLRRIIRWPQQAEPVTPELRQRWIDWDNETLAERNRFGDVARTPEVRERWQATAVFPDSTPVTRRIAFDDVGNLWVMVWTPPWERRSAWNVFDAEGRWLAGIELPVAVERFAAGTGFLATIETDSLDVEHVRGYPVALDAPAGATR